MLDVPICLLLLCLAGEALGRNITHKEDLWSLKPVEEPTVPKTSPKSTNPIDAFLGRSSAEKTLTPLGAADKLTLLRRVTFDLTGLPPSIEEQDSFIADESPRAFNKVVNRLLDSEQYGVRYGRHWLDVLRYTDVDENMPAASGIHLWRDWVIAAINDDLPYDQFVRAQVTGNRARERTKMTATGHRVPVEPRAEDVFALGFLSRGATSRGNTDQELAMTAVETISTAFMGMTVGCAKCHDHMYDPIKQSDYYSMKALFDPLVLRPVELATAEERFAHGRAVDEYERSKQEIEGPMERLIEPFRSRLYEERLLMLPPDAQTAIRKPEKTRTRAEQKIADDYYPILRIDSPKIKEIMPPEKAREYDSFLKKLGALHAPKPLPVFWTVQEDTKRATEKSYVLTTGDPARPKLDREVHPGFPFAPENVDFEEGRREAFVDWLTAPENPLFARVAVNRIWQWHFGSGLHQNPSDFGTLGGETVFPELLDYLASEFVTHDYSMKWLHRLIVTSDAYRRASTGSPESMAHNQSIDPDNKFLWRFPLQRLDAEPIRDAMLFASGELDLSVGGKSFDVAGDGDHSLRRTAYMQRGFRASAEVMPDFLTVFDVEDGRAVCPKRNQTVTAPQALFMMNNDLVDRMADHFAKRITQMEKSGLKQALVTLGYRVALGRPPTEKEQSTALAYFEKAGEGNAGAKGLAWLLLNLDEFIYIR